jgi:hypothetical protein
VREGKGHREESRSIYHVWVGSDGRTQGDIVQVNSRMAWVGHRCTNGTKSQRLLLIFRLEARWAVGIVVCRPDCRLATSSASQGIRHSFINKLFKLSFLPPSHSYHWSQRRLKKDFNTNYNLHISSIISHIS